ncbi:MAG: recombinase family protein, partial [Selenomonadaceae bacterium]|nr:recombinase family protein [Selenomonadaceae bacterium]
TFITDLTLQILSYVAQTEREFNHQRQAEGIAAAKARGVKFGGIPKERPPEFNSIREDWINGKISARKAAKLLGITHPTFIKWTKK